MDSLSQLLVLYDQMSPLGESHFTASKPQSVSSQSICKHEMMVCFGFVHEDLVMKDAKHYATIFAAIQNFSACLSTSVG